MGKGEASQQTPQIPINWSHTVGQKLQLTVWLYLYTSGTDVENCSVGVNRERMGLPESGSTRKSSSRMSAISARSMC